MSKESAQEVNRRAAALRPTLYPELETEDLHVFVRRLVEAAGYPLAGAAPPPGLRVGDRSAQVAQAALERLFLFELWSKGVSYGSGRTDDPRLMAEAIGAFVVGRATVDDMVKHYSFINFNRAASPHEAGRLLDECWRWRLEQSDAVGQLLRPLLVVCALRPRLRALFPFTSHETLLFSRTTGYPYDSMRTCARPVYDKASNGLNYVESFIPGLYEVFVLEVGPTQPSSPALHSLGTGDAEWAAAMLERQVPEDWDAAIDGTKDDLGTSVGTTTP